MKRSVLCILVLTLVFAASATLASAQTPPVFQLGFKALADQLPASVVGVPTENEHFNLSNGNSEQHTTNGLMVWRKADNWTAYTKGYITWINGPNGVQSRLNTERFPWEVGYTPPTSLPQPPSTALTMEDNLPLHYSSGANLLSGKVSNTAVGWDARGIEVLMELRDSTGKVFLEDKAEVSSDSLMSGDTLSWTYLLSADLGAGKTETISSHCRWWWWPAGVQPPTVR